MKITSKETFPTVVSAVDKLVNFVRVTYGPVGNKVLIAKGPYLSVLDDGVQIARDFEVEDETEDALIKLIKAVAMRTNDRVGDGTTSSLIILQAIIQEANKLKSLDGRKLSKELEKAVTEAKSQLQKESKDIRSKKELEQVALIASNNPLISKIIAELYFQMGQNGIITAEPSDTLEITSELTNGFKIEGGVVSPYMISDQSRNETVLENPLILVADCKLSNPNDLIPVMDKMLLSGKKDLIIVSEGVEGELLKTLVINKLQDKFRGIAVNANKETIEDVALLTGAEILSYERGTKFAELTTSSLGKARRIISKTEGTLIVGGKGDKLEISSAISKFQKSINETKDIPLKDRKVKRLARLEGNIAVIKVGANTEQEAKALRFKVEDACHATGMAYKFGVVKGAGRALAEIETSSNLLNLALKYPNRQLKENCDLTDKDLDNDAIIDSSEVLIAGIESAVSIASLLLTMKGIMVEEKKKDGEGTK